jgi:nicotinamide mononucleotide (NMN) deamidase PncC
VTEGDPELDLIDLAERLQAICLSAGLTVATAESCTGGLVAHALTEIPGSSAYFLGGVVAYADATKQAELDVPKGARRRVRSDLAGAVTGIAGPGGGTDAKPVGLTYVAVDGPAGCEVRRFVWPHDRSANKRASAAAAIDLLIACASARP